MKAARKQAAPPLRCHSTESHELKKRIIGITLVGLLLTGAGAAVPKMSTPAAATPPPTPTHTLALPEGEQRYIVKYVDDVNSEAESRALEQKGIDVKETLTHAMKASAVVATPGEIEAVKASSNVASVEIDTPVSVSGATSIWGLDRVDQRSGRDGQFSLGDEGAGVNIYVVDTGLNMSHTEFAGRVTATWWNVHDGRGVSDCAGHGTHVAGTAAGTTYGVAKKANIIPVRVLDCSGFGWSSTVMAGIDWAIAHHAAGQPAVLNLSVGGFTNDSFDWTVQSAVNDGITVVAAAGNDGVDACWSSPARVPSAITVAATNIYDAQTSWSNYGSCVDIQAPGASIRSAWTNAPTGYNTLDGTSMATPHVSGAAAILLSRDRSLSPAQVQQSMINNATYGVVGANKGATPNRLLFIPAAPAPTHPSCANLKPGDGWAGVGTHCGLRGSALSAPSSAEGAVAGADTPGGATATAAETGTTTASAESGEAPQRVDAASVAPAAETAPALADVRPAVQPVEPLVPVEPVQSTVAPQAGDEAPPVQSQAPAPWTVERDAHAVEAPAPGVEAAASGMSQRASEAPAASAPRWLIGVLIPAALVLASGAVIYGARRMKSATPAA